MTTLQDIEQSIKDCDEMTAAVRSAPPESFNMAFVEHSCGTPACVVGWWRHHTGVRSGHPMESLYGRHGTGDACWLFGSRGYLFATAPSTRKSEVDDAPFAPTPAERECMGAAWARGLSDREAALNRIAIVRAALVKWRGALVKTEAREAVTA